MQDNSFGLLEEKVLKAVSVIEELRAENLRLEAEADQWQEKYNDKQDQFEKLQKDLDQAREQLESAADMEQKRRTIEEKVGGLLSKLDSIG